MDTISILTRTTHILRGTPVRFDYNGCLAQHVSRTFAERLVHGPLTALLLLDTTIFHIPDIKLKSFEYRAINPMVINKEVTIHGAWDTSGEEKALLVWAVDEDDVVGMSGRITV